MRLGDSGLGGVSQKLLSRVDLGFISESSSSDKNSGEFGLKRMLQNIYIKTSRSLDQGMHSR